MKTIKYFLIIFFIFPLILNAQNKYVGVVMCKMCHQSEKQGKQFDIWQKSKHAEAFKTLSTPEAEKIAKEKGLQKPAAESPECLECHALTDNTKLVPFGVQCETCHGAGSAYMKMAIMKDRVKSIASGLMEFKDDAAIEKKCRTCHNAKSPTKKVFKFNEMWAKIKHPVPKE